MKTKTAPPLSTAAGELFKASTTVYRVAGRKVTKGTPGAVAEVVYSRNWYVRLKGPRGWKAYPLSQDKGIARAMAAKLADKLRRQAAGLGDQSEETMTTPVGPLVAKYLDEIRGRNKTDRYIEQTRREIVRVVKWCRDGTLAGLDWEADPDGADLLNGVALSAVTVDALDSFIASAESGRSATTKNRYRRSMVGLGRFLVRKRRLQFNPFEAANRAGGAVVRVRRALAHDDLQKLLDAARDRPVLEAALIRRGPRKGQLATLAPAYRAKLDRAGRQRALVYLTSAQTGLRYGTLRTLAVADADLATDREQWRIPGAKMKSRRPYEKAIRRDLAAALRDWISAEGKGPADRLFDLPPETVVRELKKDLKAAGIPYLDADGRRFDFHAFRHAHDTAHAVAGTEPTTRMGLMDHRDADLTLVTYTDQKRLNDRAALEALPALTLKAG